MAPPKHLSQESKREWRALTAAYSIDEAGFHLLEQFFEAKERRSAARAIVDRDGLMIDGRLKDQKIAHPMLQVERDSAAVMTRAWRLLGFDLEPARDRDAET
ncbi:MAG: hypothetical protein IPM24_02225 [Bryobacterales bacterium]|nr:hypothetical protein [Bryobacterales bacterium]